MALCSQEVVIFKAVEVDGNVDVYEQKFSEAGISTRIIQPIDFEFCNLDNLYEKLKNPDAYSGIIFTSPRAVKAVSLSLPKPGLLSAEWSSYSMFVVGESTSRCLFEQFGLKSEGAESGSAKELACRIAERQFTKTLLFPCGNLRTDAIPSSLKEKGILFEEVMVYRTCKHPMLEDNLRDAVKKGQPDCIIFFSPSGVKCTVPVMKDMFLPVDKIKFVCIGPSTAAALKECAIPVWAIAEKPNPCSLIAAVMNPKEM